MSNINTLYIGAHADDVVINAGITMYRDRANAYILTVTDGVPSGTYPRILGGITLNSHEGYRRQRLKEDKSVLEGLGINVGERYTNANIPDGQAYQNLEQIVSNIATLVQRENIRRIVTHSFPGECHPAHPDHEIVSVCSYIVSKEYGIDIWEYPRFKSNSTNKQTDRIFFEQDSIEIVRNNFTRDEITLKNEVMQIYITQKFIIEKYRATTEMFGRAVRNPKLIPFTPHFYGDSDYKPRPQDIRNAITDFLSRDNTN